MMNGQAAQQQPPDGNTPVAITLPIHVWNTILDLITNGPWKTADPLVREIHGQIQRELERQPQSAMPPSATRPTEVA